MKHILIATDFTDHSQAVRHFGAAFARVLGADVVLLHAVSGVYPATDFPTDPAVIAIGQADWQKAAQTQLDRQADDLRQQGISCEVRLESGGLSEVIGEMIEAEKIDFVVVGRTSEGTSNWFSQLLGSQATGLVSSLKVPVLMVPPEAPDTAIRRMVYATQLEFDERAILRRVFDLARTLGASVHLVKIAAPFEPDLANDEDFITDIRREFSGESFELTTREAETVSGGLVAFAEETGADLLVLTSHHHSLLDQLINPSKTRQVLVQSTRPTLVFPLS